MTSEEYNKSVDLFADGIYRFALKTLKDQEKAKDIVQDIYEKLWVKHRDVSYEKVKSYLFTSAYHASIDIIRKDSKKADWEIAPIAEISTSNQYSDISEILNMAVEQLPDIQKSVLLLRDYEGYSYEEIGEITGLNESQVKVYIFRARLFLKNYLVSIENII
jgi:RNA polymerase sigma factor (sigma-70 family)